MSCEGQQSQLHKPSSLDPLPGSYHLSQYIPPLENQRVGLVVNHTSMIDQTHLVDSLISLGVDIKVIWAPEHGFKGTAYNGEKIEDDVYNDQIEIRSLYGKNKKPSDEDLSKVDIVIFDIQDVGARFYTFISTLHYVMEAAAENAVKVVILDRPNPNGHYIDGPIRTEDLKSFVGMHPVPIVYGMTIGEYGQMINGEQWLKNNVECELTVIENSNYNHKTYYELPIPPSPNLPNQRSILLYPSLCLIEGTVVSAGRGTDMPFQVFGHPDFPNSGFQYTPKSMSSSKYPKHQDKVVNAVDLRPINEASIISASGLNLSYILQAYENLKEKEGDFFLKSNFIDKLSGTREFKKQVLSGMNEEQIKASWKEDIEGFKKIRRKYLLYED
ncbi:MAG: hypothetical protein ACI9FN_002880 [Saprospiraceae bacterium]|jgi:uncharacterized protein YbbC (DUF1343 family)